MIVFIQLFKFHIFIKFDSVSMKVLEINTRKTIK